MGPEDVARVDTIGHQRLGRQASGRVAKTEALYRRYSIVSKRRRQSLRSLEARR